MKRRQENYLKVILALCSMIFLIYIGVTLFSRTQIDITQEGLYTLSTGTKNILKKIDVPITLKLYYSKTAANKGTEGMRVFNNYFLYVRKLLEQYVKRSNNNLTLEVIDPRPDTPEEEDALAYGLKRFNLTESERYFFGLVAETEGGSEKIIEFFDPRQKDRLEYELTKLIYTTLHPQKKSVGIISSLDVLTNEVSPYVAQIMRMQGKNVPASWLVTKMLREFYTVKKIAKDSDNISGVETLIIIHPSGFPEKTLRAIDQFLLRGGKLFVLVDPRIAISSPGVPLSSPDSGFRRLLAKWGIELEENTFAGDQYLSAMGSLSPTMPPTRLLGLLNCDERCVKDYKDPMSADIHRTLFVFPGVLKVNKQEGLKYSPLISTTAHGNSYKAYGYELSNPQLLWRKFQVGNKPVVFGHKVVGTFKSAWDGPAKNSKKQKDKQLKWLTKSEHPGAVIVIADVDFIQDQFAFRQTFLGTAVVNDNSTLFLNGVEALMGSSDLMSVRSKGRVSRGFDLITKIELAAQQKTKDKVEQINASILRFQKELDSLGRKANSGNVALLQNEGLKKKRELAKQIAKLKQQLREVKRAGRERIENIGKFLQYVNTLLVPFLVVVIGLWYGRKRSALMQAKH